MTRENEIFKQIEQGNMESLDELIGLYYPEIFQYCCWHTSNRANAEDAVQETFLKAVRYMDRYAHRGKFRAFLYRIAANTCIDMSRKKYEVPVEVEILEAVPLVDTSFRAAEDETDFLRLVRQLPEEMSELVFLRYGQEMKLREIAEITGLPVRTVQSKLRYALKKLKKTAAAEQNEERALQNMQDKRGDGDEK